LLVAVLSRTSSAGSNGSAGSFALAGTLHFASVRQKLLPGGSLLVWQAAAGLSAAAERAEQLGT